MSLSQCRIIELPKIADPLGNLSFIEEYKHIPYDLKRVFFLYDYNEFLKAVRGEK